MNRSKRSKSPNRFEGIVASSLSLQRSLQDELPEIGEEWHPIPWFGHLEKAVVGTVGINPSNREFENALGMALENTESRFPRSKKIWLPGKNTHGDLIRNAIAKDCSSYFLNRPYDLWFSPLERILNHCSASYYGLLPLKCCHLDLVPLATMSKWSSINKRKQSILLERSRDMFRDLLLESSVTTLVLNGASVISEFSVITGLSFEKHENAAWKLKRVGGKDILGWAYETTTTEICGTSLGRSLRVLGFNHNIQSSFGVTSKAREGIGMWLKDRIL